MNSRMIIESFWQKKYNCACVAVIKWLLIKHGPSKALRIRTKGKYIVVSLHNGQCCSFTKKEIAELNKENCIGFRRSSLSTPKGKKIRQFVEVCFAVMVRNMQLYGYNGTEYTKETAIHALTREGIDTRRFHLLLGLKRTASKPVKLSNIQKIASQKVALLFNSKHIVVMAGNYYDDYGKARLVTEVPLLCREKATDWYSLR